MYQLMYDQDPSNFIDSEHHKKQNSVKDMIFSIKLLVLVKVLKKGHQLHVHVILFSLSLSSTHLFVFTSTTTTTMS